MTEFGRNKMCQKLDLQWIQVEIVYFLLETSNKYNKDKPIRPV